MFIFNSLLHLLLVIFTSANESEENSGSGRPVWNVDRSTGEHSIWNADSVVVRVGSTLRLTCVVDVVDLRYDVLRVSLIQGDVLLPLVENGLVHSPFSSIPRYTTSLKEDRRSGGARIAIHVEDIQSEDGGTYLCSKYSERDNSAVLNVTVLAPISDLYITSMFPDGEEFRLDSGDSEVFLQEHDFYGVGCVATVEGNHTPPEVRVEIDGRDETDSFQAIHQVDASILQSGLTLWRSHLRLALVSATPNPDYNEKEMRCIASQTGFPDVEVSTRLVVQFAPLIRCFPERLVAQQGTSATLDCNIRANPGSRITWSSARGDLTNYPNVFFDETVISSDETRLMLSIRNILPINFQRYTLTAANIISSSRATFELVEDEAVAVVTQPKVESFLPDKDSVFPEVVEAVFPGGDDDFAAMDADLSLVMTGLAPGPTSTLPEPISITVEAISTAEDGRSTLVPELSTLVDVKSTRQGIKSSLPRVKSTSSYVKSTLQHNQDMLPSVKHALPDVKSTSPGAKNASRDAKDTVPGAKSTLPPVKSTPSDVKSTFQYDKDTLPDVKSTVTFIISNSPNAKNTSRDTKDTVPGAKSTSPGAKNASRDTKVTVPGAKSTLPPVKSTSPNVKSTTLEVDNNFPGRIASPHEESLSSTDEPHSSASPREESLSPISKTHSLPARARSSHRKGTAIPLKATMDAIPVAATVPTAATNPSLASSSEEEVQQPLPAAGEVHYSLSRSSSSSSSSSSKKESGKSSETKKSTSGVGATATVQYLLAFSLLIRWL